ncbi:vesicle transport through interaction with t-SNAREs 1 [Cryptococcus deuterogattii 99/473]|uniref:Unplaced genomic scaffold supercont1.4, whole genome shotgun sequence n=1 Tax=Cryptococcus deuterogattii Ram5 TaxID=1296110 RepID=A0A0D0V3F2_9TREE|nr:vesicle transport through interaction with t-SNAREs 1 [Cryptococcus deuterogattii LA55]KIR41956.1 vesicle transport through interaction with t-SNAREs 1 [Cryptococcus deuterogattii Ram5]KIR73219.1 vesicle transport through interaction with t-SNAREs 1 [Cryptococcus deuterogattii CA1014]KIR91554.1 vesicle transport through interaction with t-SNAREs 1 [Cryptococcus deuterogattii CBS 10090]KIR98975.1 vesicle transport through interaction with t-SNAREs 1 [Cryptococcus deuterogattii 2001/935-1]KIY
MVTEVLMARSALFENYDEDLKQLFGSLKDKLDGEAKSLTGEQRKAALKRVSEEIDEAEEIVAQMEVELPSMPVSIRQTYQGRLAASKQSLDKIKKTLKDLRLQSQRSDLLSGPGYPHGDDPYTDDPEPYSTRSRLLAGTQTLEDSTTRLDNAHRIALETEGVGSEILRNLRGQRDQLENTRDTASRHLSIKNALPLTAYSLSKRTLQLIEQRVHSRR